MASRQGEIIVGSATKTVSRSVSAATPAGRSTGPGSRAFALSLLRSPSRAGLKPPRMRGEFRHEDDRKLHSVSAPPLDQRFLSLTTTQGPENSRKPGSTLVHLHLATSDMGWTKIMIERYKPTLLDVLSFQAFRDVSSEVQVRVAPGGSLTSLKGRSKHEEQAPGTRAPDPSWNESRSPRASCLVVGLLGWERAEAEVAGEYRNR